MTNYTEKLKNDLFLQSLKTELGVDKISSAKLTGGAVIDILNGRVPKDYDFVHSVTLEKVMRANLNFKLSYSSKSAMTFVLNGKVIQLLYKDPDTFAYTIEQSKYDIMTEALSNFDEQSFLGKVLVPTELAFKSKTTAQIGVKRILHWQNKGWNIQNITFQSLLAVAFKDSKKCKYETSDEDEES